MNDILPGDSARTLKSFAERASEAVRHAVGKDEGHPPLMTVDHVDLTRYAGKWYELARLPLTFMSDKALAIAEYSLNEDGSVAVHNTTRQLDEDDHTIDGTATPAEGAEQTNARLNVQFGGVLKWIPKKVEGNYWVIKVNDDYTMALVGTPDRDSLWLLARDPKQADSDEAREYIEYACEAGFDTSKLLIDDWDAGIAHPVGGAVSNETDA